jgi:isoleucyl-tRNA synthetase
MKREYSVCLHFKQDGKSRSYSDNREFDTLDNMKPTLMQEYNDLYKNDPSFVRCKVSSVPLGLIDWDLMERMSSVREMCELGNKVRAQTGIRNRQPLRNAYVAFSDRDIQDHMVYLDCSKNEYARIIGDELNVHNVHFIDEKIESKIFNYNLKPNFKALGPKGFGKQAQDLKSFFQKMEVEERNDVHSKLKNGEVFPIFGIPLTYSDIEIDFLPKTNFMSATSKVGAIVLDTAMDDELLELGFIADFRSVIQNARKTASMKLSDKIFLEVYCEQKRFDIINKFSNKLKKDLLATDIKFGIGNVDVNLAHRFYLCKGMLKSKDQITDIKEEDLDKELFYVNLYKEAV